VLDIVTDEYGNRSGFLMCKGCGGLADDPAVGLTRCPACNNANSLTGLEVQGRWSFQCPKCRYSWEEWTE
jgi:tRNA(Ile2) C34 agmatinyltransferase TiaS